MKSSFHPLKKEYEKKAEGVFQKYNDWKKQRCGAGPVYGKRIFAISLFKTGFGSLGPRKTNWKGLFLLFYEEAIGKGLAPKKPFPEYLVDKDATLFLKGDNFWWVFMSKN